MYPHRHVSTWWKSFVRKSSNGPSRYLLPTSRDSRRHWAKPDLPRFHLFHECGRIRFRNFLPRREINDLRPLGFLENKSFCHSSLWRSTFLAIRVYRNISIPWALGNIQRRFLPQLCPPRLQLALTERNLWFRFSWNMGWCSNLQPGPPMNRKVWQRTPFFR